MSPSLQFALLSCFLLGLRHGFDYDHLAAITDITSIPRNLRESMSLGLLYALGHALMIALLGVAVLCVHLSLPARLDVLDERFVGATLIGLSIYVVVSMVRSRAWLREGGTHRHVSRSRMAVLISGVRYLGWRLGQVVGAERPKPDAFTFRYDRSSVFAVGMIHGLGAETPSQLLLFLLAANLGGTSRGLIGLACFILGLLLMNTLMTAGAAGAFLGSKNSPRLQFALTSLSVVYSFAVGMIFLFGLSDKLPPLVH